MIHNRIAMISYHTCPLASLEGEETGGMNVYVLELSKKLGEMGLMVDIFTRSQSARYDHTIKLSDNVRLFHVPAGPEKSLPKKSLADYTGEFYKNIKNIISKENLVYDLIHAHYYLSGIVGLYLKRDCKIPLVISFHTLGMMKNLVARSTIEIAEKKRIDEEMMQMKKSDKIIALSQSDKEYITYLYNIAPGKIGVVTPGVNNKLFKPISKTIARRFIHADLKHVIILFVGRLEPLKGVDSLLYAFKILVSRNPQLEGKVCLWIVGGEVSQKKELWSKELQKLETLRRILGIKTSVNFVGRQQHSKLPYYYSAANVVVMPSHYETFGIVALEAIACGVPVISTYVAGLAGTFENKSELQTVPVNSPLHLAKRIETILFSSPKKTDKAIKKIWQSDSMSWSKAAEKMLSFYEKVSITT